MRFSLLSFWPGWCTRLMHRIHYRGCRGRLPAAPRENRTLFCTVDGARWPERGEPELPRTEGHVVVLPACAVECVSVAVHFLPRVFPCVCDAWGACPIRSAHIFPEPCLVSAAVVAAEFGHAAAMKCMSSRKAGGLPAHLAGVRDFGRFGFLLGLGE